VGEKEHVWEVFGREGMRRGKEDAMNTKNIDYEVGFFLFL